MVLMDKVKDGSTGIQPVFGYGGGGGFGLAGLNFEFMFQIINSDTNNAVTEPFSPPANPQPLSPSIADSFLIPVASQTDTPLFYSPLAEAPTLTSDAQPTGQGVAGLIAAAIQQQVEAPHPEIDAILSFGAPDITGQNASHAEDMSAIYSAVIEDHSPGANTPVGPIFSASIMPVANTISNFIEQHITAHHLGNGALSFVFEQNLEDGSMTSSVYHLNASGPLHNSAQQSDASIYSEADSVSSHPELNAPVSSPIDLHFNHMDSDDEGYGELLANNVIINHIENENPASPGNGNQSDSDNVPNQSSPE